MTEVDFRRVAIEAAHITSVSTVRRAIRSPQTGVGHSLAGMRAAGLITRSATVENALSAASRWMLKSHRSERVYKNAIANQLLLQRHGLDEAAIINELKVGTSVADCVVVNGRATAYEIKSELDNPAKLLKQLRDYRTAFKRVVLVTHQSLAKAYGELLTDEPVGLVVMNPQGRLRTIRAPADHTDDLSIEAMIKTLRRSEFLRIAERISGEKVDVPATALFRHCLDISRSVSDVDYCRLHEQELRMRKARAGTALGDKRFEAVRHQLLAIDPTSAQLEKLADWMSRRA